MPTPRDPDLFLKSLADAFFHCTDKAPPQSVSKRNAQFFYAAKAASIARLIALDRVLPEFEKLSNDARTLERMFEEDQLLYEFFSHSYSLIESFCFGAYFVGSQISPSHFDPDPNLRFINPRKTCNCFEQFDMNAGFTGALRAVLDSKEHDAIDIRNLLSHRFSPGRIIRPMVDIHSWDLNMWFAGDWSNAGGGVGKPLPKKEFQIESKSLIELRDWSDQQLELLGKELENLATSKGLSQK